MKRLPTFLLLILCFGMGPAKATQDPATGSVARDTADLQAPQEEDRKVFMGRRVATTMSWRGMEWLLRETRENEEATSLLLPELELERGDVVCDLGAGNGYLSLPLAETVGPAGRVLAVDIQQQMLRALEKRAAAIDLSWIETVLGDLDNPHLEPGSCDLILLADVYHEFSRPVSMLWHMRRALREGGRVALLEFRSEDPKVPIKASHKMSKRQQLQELAAQGLEFESEFDGLPWQHLVFFVSAARLPETPLERRRAAGKAVALGFERALLAGDARSLSGFVREKALPSDLTQHAIKDGPRLWAESLLEEFDATRAAAVGVGDVLPPEMEITDRRLLASESGDQFILALRAERLHRFTFECGQDQSWWLTLHSRHP